MDWIVEASYVGAYLIAKKKKSKPVSDGEFVRNALIVWQI